MLPAISAVTARHRRPILLGAVVVAVGHGVARWQLPRDDAWIDKAALGLLLVVLLWLVLVSVDSWLGRPAVFAIHPEVPAFSTPPGASDIPGIVLFTVLPAEGVGWLADSTRARNLDLMDVVWPALWIVAAGLLIVRSWRGCLYNFGRTVCESPTCSDH